MLLADLPSGWTHKRGHNRDIFGTHGIVLCLAYLLISGNITTVANFDKRLRDLKL